MSWLRRSRPAYAVDGVEAHRNSEGWDIYEGNALAGEPIVAEAVARLPHDPALEHLLFSVGIGTADGHEWTLSFGDEARIFFDLSYPGSDIFEEALTAMPWTGSVERVDRDVFVFTTTGMLKADVVLAHCIDVCGEVFPRAQTVTRIAVNRGPSS
jgi:hypothetical protein